VSSPAENTRLLNRIIVSGLSLAFSTLIASLQTLRPASSGFAFEFSWWTLLAFIAGAIAVVPCFLTIVYSPRKTRRTIALAIIILIGICSFLYPLRFVPKEKFSAIFSGLALAALALAIVAAFLLLVRRFFEKDS
jgi:hypothetical protein